MVPGDVNKDTILKAKERTKDRTKDLVINAKARNKR